MAISVAIGGRKLRTRRFCVLAGTLHGKRIVLQAVVLPRIGTDADGREIDVLFGANAMQDYGIRLVPEEERVDLADYHDTFVEL